MSWNVFRVLGPDDEDPMYPSVGSGSYPFELEPDDGNVKRYISKGFVLYEYLPSGAPKRVAALKDERVEVYVTECRIVYVVEAWNKGSRYWGIGLGGTDALIKNISNHIREARARRGRLMIGHVRYNWLAHVGAQRSKGLMGNNILSVCLAGDDMNTGRKLRLDVNFGRDGSVIAVADLIASRAAKFWIALGDVADETRSVFDAMINNAEPLAPPRGRMEVKKIPQYQWADPRTVRALHHASPE